MHSSLVEAAIAPLLATTSGWDDDAVEYYVADLSRLADSECLETACRGLARSWTANRRPPLATILEAYQVELRHQAIAVSSLGEDSCEVCDGTGYVEVLDDRRHAPWCRHHQAVHSEGDCNCHAVEPCGACA